MRRASFRQLRRYLLSGVLLGVALGGMAYYAGHTGNHNGATTFGEAVAIGVFFAVAALVIGSLDFVIGCFKVCTRAAGTRLRGR